MGSVYPTKIQLATLESIVLQVNRLIDLLNKDLSVVVEGGGVGDVQSPIIPGVIDGTIVLYDGLSGKRLKASTIYANWFDQAVATTSSPTFVGATIGGVVHPINTSGFLSSSAIDNTVYGIAWDNDTTHAPSKNALYDKIETLGSGGGDVEIILDKIVNGGEGEINAQLEAIMTGGAMPPLSAPMATEAYVNGKIGTPLAGTKVYYVADSSGGAVTRKLTFVNGLLTSEV